jgi:hypothetical protein
MQQPATGDLNQPKDPDIAANSAKSGRNPNEYQASRQIYEGWERPNPTV